MNTPQTEAAASNKPKTAERDAGVFDGINVKTLFASVGASVFLFGIMQWVVSDKFSTLQGIISGMDARLERIPTRDEFGSEIERAAATQRLEFLRESQRLSELNAQTAQSLQVLQSRTQFLENRIAAVGVDSSMELIRYIRSIREGQRPQTDGAGGYEGDEEILEDFATQLFALYGGLSAREARETAQQALAHPTGASADRLLQYAQQHRERRLGTR